MSAVYRLATAAELSDEGDQLDAAYGAGESAAIMRRQEHPIMGVYWVAVAICHADDGPGLLAMFQQRDTLAGLDEIRATERGIAADSLIRDIRNALGADALAGYGTDQLGAPGAMYLQGISDFLAVLRGDLDPAATPELRVLTLRYRELFDPDEADE